MHSHTPSHTPARKAPGINIYNNYLYITLIISIYILYIYIIQPHYIDKEGDCEDSTSQVTWL